MSLGDTMLGAAVGTAGQWSGDADDKALSNFVLNLMDVYKTQGDMADANVRTEEAYQRSAALADAAGRLGMEDAGYNKALRNAIYANIASQQGVMTDAFNAMGAPVVVDPATIEARRGALTTQYMDDVNAAAALTNSQGYADNIRRGVGTSTVEDNRRIVSASNLARERMKARNQAYTDAVTQATQEESLRAANRGNIMKQYADLFNVPITNQLGLYKEAPSASNALYAGMTGASNVYGKVQDYGKSAAKAAGTSWTDFYKKLPGQLDDYFDRRKPDMAKQE